MGQLGKKNNNGNNEVDLDSPKTPGQNPARTHCIPARFQQIADISILVQSEASRPHFTES